MTSLPECLLASVPVLQPPHLEGDLSLATEILPGPPSLASVQQQAVQKRDPKKVFVPAPSYLPTSDPGSTYGAGMSGGMGGLDAEGPRRKRLRIDKGSSGTRAKRASARSHPSPTNGISLSDRLVPNEAGPSSPPPTDQEPLNVPADPDAPMLSRSNSSQNVGEGSASVFHPGRRGRRGDKGKETAVVRVKQEQVPVNLSLSEPHFSLPNDDHCSACTSIGALLYCDGCPRAFHLWCLDPPMEARDLPGEDSSWFCPACRIHDEQPPKPPPSFMSPLIMQVQSCFPTEFRLPDEIKGFFKDIATGLEGSYVDTSGNKPPRLNRHGQLEDRDPHRLKDRNGAPVLCFQCGTSALPSVAGVSTPTSKRPRRSVSQKSNGLEVWRSIVSCDHCDLHWHLDCLDPPLASMPPHGKKWMCPNHADHILPKRRIPKNNAPPIDVTRAAQANNGNIDIIPSEIPTTGQEGIVTDEILINGRRYRVPERVIVLDFWSKIGGARSKPCRDTSPSSRGSSPLTSLSSLDDVDDAPPAVNDPPARDVDELRIAQLLCDMRTSHARSSNGRHQKTFVDISTQTDPQLIVPSTTSRIFPPSSSRKTRVTQSVAQTSSKRSSENVKNANPAANPAELIKPHPPKEFALLSTDSQKPHVNGRPSPSPPRSRKRSTRKGREVRRVERELSPTASTDHAMDSTTDAPRATHAFTAPKTPNGNRLTVLASTPTAGAPQSPSRSLTIRLPRLSNFSLPSTSNSINATPSPSVVGARRSLRRQTSSASSSALGLQSSPSTSMLSSTVRGGGSR